MQSQDLTLQSGASGVDVVDATILKIDSVSADGDLLQNDLGFLKRIALVESNFGDEVGQYEDGGIWQVC